MLGQHTHPSTRSLSKMPSRFRQPESNSWTKVLKKTQFAARNQRATFDKHIVLKSKRALSLSPSPTLEFSKCNLRNKITPSTQASATSRMHLHSPQQKIEGETVCLMEGALFRRTRLFIFYSTASTLHLLHGFCLHENVEIISDSSRATRLTEISKAALAG